MLHFNHQCFHSQKFKSQRKLSLPPQGFLLICLLWVGWEGTPFACFLGGASGKESTCNIGDMNSNPGSGRSPKERNSNLLQYSCLENSMDKGTWWAKVHGVTKNQTFWACTQFYHVACGILVPWPGTESMPLAGKSLICTSCFDIH